MLVVWRMAYSIPNPRNRPAPVLNWWPTWRLLGSAVSVAVTRPSMSLSTWFGHLPCVSLSPAVACAHHYREGIRTAVTDGNASITPRVSTGIKESSWRSSG